MNYPSNFKLKLTLEYDGTDYFGWQIQPNRNTIQDVVENTLKVFINAEYKKQNILGCIERVKVKASGRTDRGVHALGQVISFLWPSDLELDEQRFLKSINGISPRSIAFLDVETVQLDFDAQYSAINKHYRYCISRRYAPLCLQYGRAWRVTDIKDIQAINDCLEIVRGTHDFASFRASDCVAKTTIRTLEDVYMDVKNQDLEINFIGTGFLKNMVRYLIASIVEVGRGNKDCSYIKGLIDLKERDPHIKLAPAGGLFLVRVGY